MDYWAAAVQMYKNLLHFLYYLMLNQFNVATHLNILIFHLLTVVMIIRFFQIDFKRTASCCVL